MTTWVSVSSTKQENRLLLRTVFALREIGCNRAASYMSWRHHICMILLDDLSSEFARLSSDQLSEDNTIDYLFMLDLSCLVRRLTLGEFNLWHSQDGDPQESELARNTDTTL